METGIIKTQSKENDLWELMESVCEQGRQKAVDKDIDLVFERGENSLTALCDFKWTREACFNILDNAVKYTGREGNIEISVSVQEIFTKISIRDSGKGIALERQAEIFTRFYREPEVYDQEGIGVGLYLARKIITMQGGYIQVCSEVGKGSDFQIYLPNG